MTLRIHPPALHFHLACCLLATPSPLLLQQLLLLPPETDNQKPTAIAPGKRCQLLPASTDGRRGTVRFVGAIPSLPAPLGPWVGIELDEPTGRNDGSVKDGTRYFECKPNCGVFVRPERVEVGDFEVVDEFAEEMEEI